MEPASRENLAFPVVSMFTQGAAVEDLGCRPGRLPRTAAVNESVVIYHLLKKNSHAPRHLPRAVQTTSTEM